MKTTQLILSAVTLVGLTACGEFIPSNDRWIRGQLKSSTFSYTTSALSDSNFTCPTIHNVLENYDHDLRPTGKYTACTSNHSAFQIRLHGTTLESDTVCVFPARFHDPTRILASLDRNGYPLYACATIQSERQNGLIYEFSEVNFNYVFVVEGHQADQMQMCLFSQNPQLCPEHYSKGRIR